MKRPDLPQGNDGWQALDGTPQEISQGEQDRGGHTVHVWPSDTAAPRAAQSLLYHWVALQFVDDFIKRMLIFTLVTVMSDLRLVQGGAVL
jgi:hypothetical protein